MSDGSLDELADRLRVEVVALRFERLTIAPAHELLPWAMLQESEREQWRDIARAATAVMG